MSCFEMFDPVSDSVPKNSQFIISASPKVTVNKSVTTQIL